MFATRKLTNGLALLALFFVFSCGDDADTMLKNINGYWEISEVTLPDGSKRDFSFNGTIDYIEIKNGKGFRKKMTPQFDGSFLASDDMELIQVKFQNDSLNIHYSTEFTNWNETVLKATQEELLIINQQKVLYLYKRFEPMKIE